MILNRKHLSYLFLLIASLLLAIVVLWRGHVLKVPNLHIAKLERKQPERSDTLSVCLFYHAADYFVYQGSVIGFQYDILKQLEKAFPDTPVTLEDERFTSVLAHRIMIDGGMKASQRRDKKEVDKISAAIILQSYLDRENGGTLSVDPSAVPDSLSMNKTRRKK